MFNKIAALVLTVGFANVAHAEFTVDYNQVALVMYSTYMSYENGAAALKGVEENCWKRVKTDKSKEKAILCLGSGMTAVVIENAFANNQGRQPAPFFNSEVFGKRVREQYRLNSLPLERMQKDTATVVNSLPAIIMGLSNAGMH